MAVLEVAVTGVEDKSRGQAVKAPVVLQKGYEASKELAKEIQLFAKNIAASYKSPRIIDFVTELPKTISGKIRRATIRDKDAADASTSSATDNANTGKNEKTAVENAMSEKSE